MGDDKPTDRAEESVQINILPRELPNSRRDSIPKTDTTPTCQKRTLSHYLHPEKTSP